MDHQGGSRTSFLESEEGDLELFEPMLERRLRANTWPSSRFCQSNDEQASLTNQSTTPDAGSGRSSHDDSHVRTNTENDELGVTSQSASSGGNLTFAASPNSAATPASAAGKKNSSRRNAWGNMSYADLITEAINSSAEKRLTLSQIYDWMVQNISFFKDKGDSNSSAGWKNSIRHNLSLHNRFKREQNEGTGKSSWWTINADAKPGKSTRRRAATMESPKYEKRRGRVRKQLEERRRLGSDASSILLGGRHSPSSPINEMSEYTPSASSAPGISLSPLHNPSLHALQEPFRSRTNSNASSYGRLSPTPLAGDHTPALSPHPWAVGESRDEESCTSFQPQLAELDAQMNQAMQLHDSGGYLREKTYNAPSQHNGSFFQGGGETRWTKPISSFGLVDSKSADMSTVMNAQHFSGGSFVHIPEQQKPLTPKQPRHNVLPPPPANQSQRLPSLAGSQFTIPATTGEATRFLNHQQFRHALLRPAAVIQTASATATNGSFPDDLAHFMEQGFSGVDVQEVLNYEMTLDGNLNLSDVNFDMCMGSGGTGATGAGSSSPATSTAAASLQSTNHQLW